MKLRYFLAMGIAPLIGAQSSPPPGVPPAGGGQAGNPTAQPTLPPGAPPPQVPTTSQKVTPGPGLNVGPSQGGRRGLNIGLPFPFVVPLQQ
jgi:hypothetical protein